MGRSSICTDYYSSQIFDLEERPPTNQTIRYGSVSDQSLIGQKQSYNTADLGGVFH